MKWNALQYYKGIDLIWNTMGEHVILIHGKCSKQGMREISWSATKDTIVFIHNHAFIFI